MTDFQKDMKQLRDLAEDAVSTAVALGAWTNGTELPPEKFQRLLERSADDLEQAAVRMRVLCEKNSPGVGGYGERGSLPAQDVVGSVDKIGYGWLHISLHTLLPHCRYEAPLWLRDTIRRLLDAYELQGGTIPFFRQRAALIIDEHSDIAGRSIYDQDNKGWKAVSNALKGRVIADDDQYTLTVILLSTRSAENETHLTLMDLQDAADFLLLHASRVSPRSVYMSY